MAFANCFHAGSSPIPIQDHVPYRHSPSGEIAVVVREEEEEDLSSWVSTSVLQNWSAYI